MENKFSAATLRLTTWYLAVLMFISIVFSVALYQTSSRELASNIKRQTGRLNDLRIIEGGIGEFTVTDLWDELEQSRAHLRASLIVYNLIILAAGGAASYWFARRTLRPIESALEAQSRFTADASHELRTPLTAMRSEIEVALRDKSLQAEEARELLQSNLEEIDKLETLSNSLLQLAHYEEGRASVQLSKISLAPVIEKSVTGVAKVAEKRKITIATELASIKLNADPTGLRELFTILLDNAVKYSPNNTEIAVRSSVQNHFAVVTVEDHGVGIKASEIPHLFDRFYRADTSRSKTHVDGYGLGLAIAKSIVDAHRGSIEVSSLPHKGSTFTVKLPLGRLSPDLPV